MGSIFTVLRQPGMYVWGGLAALFVVMGVVVASVGATHPVERSTVSAAEVDQAVQTLVTTAAWGPAAGYNVPAVHGWATQVRAEASRAANLSISLSGEDSASRALVTVESTAAELGMATTVAQIAPLRRNVLTAVYVAALASGKHNVVLPIPDAPVPLNSEDPQPSAPPLPYTHIQPSPTVKGLR